MYLFPVLVQVAARQEAGHRMPRQVVDPACNNNNNNWSIVKYCNKSDASVCRLTFDPQLGHDGVDKREASARELPRIDDLDIPLPGDFSAVRITLCIKIRGILRFETVGEPSKSINYL